MSDVCAANGVIDVRGGASPEEIAAVLAVVGSRPSAVREDALQRWRRLRQAVSKAT